MNLDEQAFLSRRLRGYEKSTSTIKWHAAIDDLRELLHTLLQHLVGHSDVIDFRGLERSLQTTRRQKGAKTTKNIREHHQFWTPKRTVTEVAGR